MFYCVASTHIGADRGGVGAVLIDADTREGCIERVAEFVRNVLGGRNGKGNWAGRNGMVRCMFQAVKDDYIVFDIDWVVSKLRSVSVFTINCVLLGGGL